VDIVDTKPIAEDVLSLVTKRTTSFNKALKELQEHQFLLEELSSVTNNFSIAYTDSSSSEEDDEVLEDEVSLVVVRKCFIYFYFFFF
jgi:hypothetical protein